MENGWIKLHKKILNWEWYNNKNTKIVFLHLLLTVNWEDGDWQGTPISRGQRIVSLRNLAEECSLTLKECRTAIIHLKRAQEVAQSRAQKGHSSFSLFTVKNYSAYQTKGTKSGTERAQPIYNEKRREEEKKITPTPFSEILEHFKKEFRTSLCVLTDKRQEMLKARLEKWSLEQVKQAISNYAKDPFYTGKNDRGWKANLDFCIRNDEQIEKGLNLQPTVQRSFTEDELRANMKNFNPVPNDQYSTLEHIQS